MSVGMPPLPPPFREQLLPTDADAVDASTADAIRVFCEGEPEIEAAYVCLVKRTREGEEPERALRLSVTLTEPAGSFDGSHPQHLPLIERFVQAHPDVARRFGFGVLTGNGVPPFERYGLTIYRR
jgi:hypothetical protein